MHIQLFRERAELKTLFGIKLSESTWKPPQVFSISCTNVIHYTHLKHRSCDWINSHSVPGEQYHLNIASSVITGCGSIKNLTSENSAGPPNRQHVCHCHKINKHFAFKNLVLTTFICVLSYLSWCKLFRTAILNWVSKGLPSTDVGEGFVTYCECVNPSKGVRMKPKLLELCRSEVDVNDSHKTGQRSVLYNSHLGQNHPYRIHYWRYDLTKSVYLCVCVCVCVCVWVCVCVCMCVYMPARPTPAHCHWARGLNIAGVCSIGQPFLSAFPPIPLSLHPRLSTAQSDCDWFEEIQTNPNIFSLLHNLKYKCCQSVILHCGLCLSIHLSISYQLDVHVKPPKGEARKMCTVCMLFKTIFGLLWSTGTQFFLGLGNKLILNRASK